MGSDLYDVTVERFRAGTVDTLVKSATDQGLDAEGVRAILGRMGNGERAVEIDLYIRQIHCDARIWCIDHGFMAMVMHDAGWAGDKLHELQERIATHFGGFDNINSYDFAYGPEAACFAFSLLERGQVAGEKEDPSEEEEDYVPPDDDWARVRVWMAWELGQHLEGKGWTSRAWVPGQRTMWISHMPVTGLPALEQRRNLDPEMQYICGLAMARGRLFCIGESGSEVVCCEADTSECLWRSEALQGGSSEGFEVTVSADGDRLYVTGGEGWCARAPVQSNGESAEVLPCGGAGAFTLEEDNEGRLFEIQHFGSESEDESPGGAIWERDRKTGERLRMLAELREGDECLELACHAFARRAPVGAAAAREGLIVVWNRGEVQQRWTLSGSEISVAALALSESGDTLYIARRHDGTGHLEAWSVASAELLWSAPLLFDARSGYQLALLPGGRHLALSGGWQVGLFDLERRGEVLAQSVIPGQRNVFLHALGVSAEGDFLYVSLHQRTVLLWPLGRPS